ncbi:SCP2 sterol-binding domain-containing protein [Alcanivorax sp. 1008]|uniref:SCP2 sterol-binding domain-containing protein n=1 Tax=Alcanivorax sp. 1008 TaxID=2816853 RepID=UPI001D21ECA6|nr:SCP2 sterol-binding domain-containing protein [Alcanivorax sp. 1008]MCC1497627.1 SCP2 sterol-binding domain-containing protein [Alcanivorax sp. 1008]MDF1629275.1 SCP2 sterol-binding domain-containing protein [Alcanivoracaceae bacterium]
MSQEFLSEGWFAMVKTLRDEAGALEAPAALADLIINVTITGGSVDKAMSLVGGMLEEGHHPNAPTTMILPADLAKRIFIEGDQSAGMQGFMTGQIRIEGDMSKLMALQTAQPTAAQVELMKKIAAETA